MSNQDPTENELLNAVIDDEYYASLTPLQKLMQKAEEQKQLRREMLLNELEARTKAQPANIDWSPLAQQLEGQFGQRGLTDVMSNQAKQQLIEQRGIEDLRDKLVEQPKVAPEEILIRESEKEKDRAFKEEQAALDRASRAENARIMAGLKQEARDTKADLDLEKSREKLAKNLDQAPDLANTISSIEKQLGFSIDDVDLKTGKVAGKDVDIPGVSIPLIGRVSPTETSRDLQSDLARIFNTELRTRSGTAVTSPELDRLRTEFASGKFNTEPEMLKALRRYKEALRKRMAQVEAAARPEAVASFESQGGQTSRTLFKTGKASQQASSNSDEAALRWAQANPNDPRSAAILQKLQLKEGVAR